jgi:hypothetical protein
LKVKILKSNGNEYWYANSIGETFEVDENIMIDDDGMENYYVLDEKKAIELDEEWDEDCCGYYILKDDCEIIEE